MRLSRRSVVGGALALSAPAPAAAQTESAPPNIIFILADDLGAFDLSCYGRPDYETPRIDRLARQGVRLTQAYANSPVCSPTRTALISGRYQQRLLVGNYDPLVRDDIGFPPEHPTLPSLLHEHNYHTALIGKWHIGRPPAFGPLRSGYNEFFGFMGGALDYYAHDYPPDIARGAAASAARQPDLYDGEQLVDIEGYATDLFTARALDFVARDHKRPFFLSLHYSAPHWPWQTRDDAGGPRQTDLNFESGSREIYGAMVWAMDDGIGRLLQALDRRRLSRNTIVVFTSDNGGDRFSYRWPLRGGKSELWEGGIRVPAIVRWPGRIRANSICNQIAITMDWLPTLLAAASGAPHPDYPSDGVDIMPFLRGAECIDRTLYWRSSWQGAVRDGPWKYLRSTEGEYLLNLTEDDTEHANYRAREPERFAALRAAYDAWNAQMPPVPADAPGDTSAILRHLGTIPPR